MAITFVTSAAAVYGAASVTPTIGATQVATNMMILVATGKPFDLGWSVATAGWTALGSGASGSTAAGVDVGSMKAQVWYKEATVDPETNPTVTEGTPVWNIAGAVVQVFARGAGETWDTPVVVYGADEVSGTSISATMSADPGVTAGDFVVLLAGMNTDALGPLTGNLAVTQTGVTFGAPVEREDSETTTGGDMAMAVSYAPVNSGTGSAAPVITGTGTASGGADRVEVGFVRLRLAAAADPFPLFTVPDMSIYPGPSTV